MTAPRIDAHQHFWKLGQFNTAWLEVPAHAPIRRDFLPRDLRPLLDAAGVERSVFVQTQHDPAENRWALKLADEHPWICGVVGWIDLASDACEDQLLEFRADPASPSFDKQFDPAKNVIVYCAGGGRAALAGKLLKEMGYQKVYNLGGFKDWAEAGGKVEK